MSFLKNHTPGLTAAIAASLLLQSTISPPAMAKDQPGMGSGDLGRNAARGPYGASTFDSSVSGQSAGPIGRPVIGGMQSQPQGMSGQGGQPGQPGQRPPSQVKVSPISGIGTEAQTYGHGGHMFSITPAPGTRFQTMEKASGKSFNFLGPRRADGSSSIFSVMILIANQSHPMPTKEELLGKLVMPYKKHLTKMSLNQVNLNLANGDVGSGVEYSGTVSDKGGARGFFIVIPVNNAFYVLSGSDRTDQYDQSAQIFATMASTLAIQG